MAPLPAPAEKPSHRVSDSQSHAKVRPPTQVAVFCAALWPNLQPALTLIRKDQDRQRLRGLLLEGAASPQAATADADYFDQLRDRVREAGRR